MGWVGRGGGYLSTFFLAKLPVVNAAGCQQTHGGMKSESSALESGCCLSSPSPEVAGDMND